MQLQFWRKGQKLVQALRLLTYAEQAFRQWILMLFLFSGDNMTVLNTADWLLSCNVPSSATSMRDDGTLHAFACVDCPSGLLSVAVSMSAPLFCVQCLWKRDLNVPFSLLITVGFVFLLNWSSNFRLLRSIYEDWHLNFIKFSHVTKFYSSFDIFQLFKSVKAVRSSQAV